MRHCTSRWRINTLATDKTTEMTASIEFGPISAKSGKLAGIQGGKTRVDPPLYHRCPAGTLPCSFSVPRPGETQPVPIVLSQANPQSYPAIHQYVWRSRELPEPGNFRRCHHIHYHIECLCFPPSSFKAYKPDSPC